VIKDILPPNIIEGNVIKMKWSKHTFSNPHQDADGKILCRYAKAFKLMQLDIYR
jgi:hypothetical protein